VLLTSVLFLCPLSPSPPIYTLSLHDALPISARGCRSPARCTAPSCASWGLPARAVPARRRRGSRPGGTGRDRAEAGTDPADRARSEEHTSELQSRFDLVCRLLLEKKNKTDSV